MMRMRPAWSTTNSRRVPSGASTRVTGEVNPSATSASPMFRSWSVSGSSDTSPPLSHPITSASSPSASTAPYFFPHILPSLHSTVPARAPACTHTRRVSQLAGANQDLLAVLVEARAVARSTRPQTKAATLANINQNLELRPLPTGHDRGVSFGSVSQRASCVRTLRPTTPGGGCVVLDAIVYLSHSVILSEAPLRACLRRTP